MNKRERLAEFAVAFPELELPTDMRKIRTGWALIGAHPPVVGLEILRSMIYVFAYINEQWVPKQYEIADWRDIGNIRRRHLIKNSVLIVNERIDHAKRPPLHYKEFILREA